MSAVLVICAQAEHCKWPYTPPAFSHVVTCPVTAGRLPAGRCASRNGGSQIWLSTAILAGSSRACKLLEGTEARSLHICTLEGGFLPEELTDEGLKLLHPTAAIRCLTLRITGVTVAQRKTRPSSCDGYTEF